MPVQLDEMDIAILKSLMEDGRKSFRAVSRDTKISTPTVKARYERLVNIGLIKSVRPEIDLSKIDRSRRNHALDDMVRNLKSQKKHFHVKLDDLRVKLQCDFCGGPVNGRPKVLKFAGIERFFCCISCRTGYKEKYGGRIRTLQEQYRERRVK